MKNHYLEMDEVSAKKHLQNLKPWVIAKDNFFDVGDVITFKIIDDKGMRLSGFKRKIIDVDRSRIFGLNSDYCVLTIK